MTSSSVLVVISLLLNAASLVILFFLFRRGGNDNASSQIAPRIEALDRSLAKKITDLAVQIADARGNINTEVTQRLGEGLQQLRSAVDAQLVQGRTEQSTALSQVTGNLESKFDQLNLRQTQSAQEARNELAKSLEAIRSEMDRKLIDITGQVQTKLDQNIKEGFSHFEKVREHLQQAEEQLRNVGTLGASIHDLNNLLKLPHLRGKF